MDRTLAVGNTKGNAAQIRTLRKKLSVYLAALKEVNCRLPSRVQFDIRRHGSLVQVMRRDFHDEMEHLSGISPLEYKNVFERLSVSEHAWMTQLGAPEDFAYPVTLHDVFHDSGITIKTGNPYCNNAWLEFFYALLAREKGIVEAKAPLGFIFHMDDPSGTSHPGAMFYKHLDGSDMEKVLKEKNNRLANWCLWEAAKFFSRFIGKGFFLEDPDRMGNFFVENHGINTFRFLDLERMMFLPRYPDAKKAAMLIKFIRAALNITKTFGVDFLTPEKMDEFLRGCLDPDCRAFSLVYSILAETVSSDPSFPFADELKNIRPI